ncbi:hypothetical protein [Bacillus sp. T33-2]|uniref:hypothetical protein n=1 Tax=Bacillus sp. T33-2 TaxID=2054168 RepID=UPI000C7595AD|nr:hypothetical protein [Bacillus sp. T33-2]PLR94116.1 hypothetical protein CVD19_17695 [Bacillus sp. T33-2]
MSIIISVAAGVAIIMAVSFFTGNKSKNSKLIKENIPRNLGILNGVPLAHLSGKLDAAFGEEYVSKVRSRYLKQHPEITEDEFEWRLFELKRYFLLNSLLKSTPMFSEEVDDIWHEMLMFTEDYQRFSEKYIGTMLHHTPNLDSEPVPQERAFFDWVFSQLFEITEYSWKAWGGFFRYPLDQKVLQDFKNLNTDGLLHKYFKVKDESKELAVYLIMKMKKQINESQAINTENERGHFSRPATYGDLTSLSLVMVFFSYYYFDDYWAYVNKYAFANQFHSTSGCSSASFCGSGSQGSDGKGDSSCSSGSCSSCGGGCSS